MASHSTEKSISSAATLGRFLVITIAYFALVMVTKTLWPSLWSVVPALCCSFIFSGFLNAAHDCVHSTHARPKWLNRVLGAAWCTVILVNFTIYRQQHLVHHRFPGIEGDSEAHADFKTVSDYVRAQSGVGFWFAIFRRMLLTWRGRFPPSVVAAKAVQAAHVDNVALAVWLLTATILTFYWPIELLVSYWLPLLFYPAFALFFSLPEHLELTRADAKWPRARDVRSNAVVRFFQWNANYHSLHHRQPGIPAHALHRVYAGSFDFNDPAETSYLRFHATLIARLWRGHLRTV